MDLRSLMLFASISGLLALPLQAADVSTCAQKASPEQLLTQLSVKQLQRRVRLIAVKVLSENSWGPEIVIQRQGQVYTVLTNQHVLAARKRHRIQTADGRIYPANLLRSIRSDDDLGLVQFRSPNVVYPVTLLKNTSRLAVGDRVFAAGFSFDINPSKSGGFEFTTGQISAVLNQPFIGNYQIGYTNDVKRGMSGGPLLNRQGEVVGVNGMPKYPLGGDPYVYKDGSRVSDAMWERMSHLSWAVPIQTFLHLNAKSYSP